MARPAVSRVTRVAWPAPLRPDTWLMTNGPDGTAVSIWRTPLTYRLTALGTTDDPASDATGKVSKSGRRSKLLRHCTPPMRSDRLQVSDEEIRSPTCQVSSVCGSEWTQEESRRTYWVSRLLVLNTPVVLNTPLLLKYRSSLATDR